MSQNLTVNGVVYPYPDVSDENWGQNATDWAVAVTAGMLQKAGGSFTLTADVDFGASFGLKSLYYKSRATNPSSAGIVRLGNAEVIGWRNQGNSGDVTLTVNASNLFAFSAGVSITGGVTFSGALTISATTNQLILGTTNTTTINAAAPAASRVYSFEDAGTNANFVMSAGTQTVNGAKTFGNALTISASSGNVLVVDTTTLVVDATNDAVGIGIASPSSASLHIQTSGTSTSLRIKNTGTGASDFIIQTSNAGDDGFHIYDVTAALYRLSIVNSTGFVGLKTNTPVADLDIRSATGGGDCDLAMISEAQSRYWISASNSVNAFLFGANGATRPADSAFHLSITAGGNVGIGTTAPGTKLQITSSAPVVTITDSGGTSSNSVTLSISDGSLAIAADPASVVASTTITMATDGSIKFQVFSAGVITTALQSGVSAQASGATTIPTGGADTKVLFGTENYDIQSEFASSTFTAQRAGKYVVTAKVLYGSPADGRWITKLYKNGAALLNLDTVIVAGGNSDLQVGGCAIVSLAVSDTLDIYASNGSGTNEDTVAASSTFFHIAKIA